MKKKKSLRIAGRTQLFMEDEIPNGPQTEVKVAELGTGDYILQVIKYRGATPNPDAFVGYRDEYSYQTGSIWPTEEAAVKYAIEEKGWVVVGESE